MGELEVESLGYPGFYVLREKEEEMGIDEWYRDDWYDPIMVEEPVVQRLHPIFDPKQVGEYMNQTKIWIDANRTEHRIKNLDERYLVNILSWINRKRGDINFAANLVAAATEDYGSYIDIQYSPLYNKLQKRYLKVSGQKPKQSLDEQSL